MQPLDFEALLRCISPERFNAYRRRGEGDLDALARCLWDMSLAESLHPVVNGLEVGLRNALLAAGQSCFGEVPTRDVPCWLDADPPILLPGEARKVEEAKRRLRAMGKPLAPGAVVAELSFGFWTALFDVRYESSQVLWPRLFRHGIFAGAPRRMRSRNALSPLLNRVRNLRNRAFHHEPVWHWRDLAQQHAMALKLLGWINPGMRHVVEVVDRFPDVHAAGPEVLRRQLGSIALPLGVEYVIAGAHGIVE